jgi:hypothetical protein
MEDLLQKSIKADVFKKRYLIGKVTRNYSVYERFIKF